MCYKIRVLSNQKPYLNKVDIRIRKGNLKVAANGPASSKAGVINQSRLEKEGEKAETV
jgi:hypothetical protein